VESLPQASEGDEGLAREAACGHKEVCSSSSLMELGPQKHAMEINELGQHVLQLLQLAFSKCSPVLQLCSNKVMSHQAVCPLVILDPEKFGTDILHEKEWKTLPVSIDNHYTLYSSETFI